MIFKGKKATDYIDEITSGLIGYCEDRIYCASYKDDCMNLDMESCREIICNYLKKEEKMNEDQARKKVFGVLSTNYKDGYIMPGNCYRGLKKSELENHWYTKLNRVTDYFADPSTTCHMIEGFCVGKSEPELRSEGYDQAWDAWCLPFDFDGLAGGDYEEFFGAKMDE